MTERQERLNNLMEGATTLRKNASECAGCEVVMDRLEQAIKAVNYQKRRDARAHKTAEQEAKRAERKTKREAAAEGKLAKAVATLEKSGMSRDKIVGLLSE